MIACLNRHFVSCYFNASPRGPGGDAAANAFIRKHRLPLRYGGIVTTEGKLLVAFGYDRVEVFTAFQKVLADKDPTEAESAILGKGGLPAARVASDRLDYKAARRHAALAVKAARNEEEKARALYALGHILLLDVANPDPAAVRVAFDAIGKIPDDIADDIALDRIALEVELTPRHGFYTGWRLKPAADEKAIAASLAKWIERAPKSNRIGQMHFFLGLARRALKDNAGADAIWKTHYTNWPDDRWSMLSRIHHTSYRFSPYKKNVGKVALDPALQKKLKDILEKGGGAVTDPEVLREILRQMEEQKRRAEKK